MDTPTNTATTVDDLLAWVKACDLLTDSAIALWSSMDSTTRDELLVFLEVEGRQLLRLAGDLRATID